MTVFGEIEQFISEELYPYRWPILAAAVAVAAAGIWLAYQRRWHEILIRYPARSGVVILVAVAVLAYPVYYLGSPLVSGGKTVCEASPITGAGAGSERCAGVAEAAVDAAGDATATPAPDGGGMGASAAQVVSQGEFQGADDFHSGRGQALLIEEGDGSYVLRFENFEVRNGPDLFVYLSSNPEGYSDDALELGKLKGTKGAFNYDVPMGTDVSRFRSAVVWCKAFGVLFATAALGEM